MNYSEIAQRVREMNPHYKNSTQWDAWDRCCDAFAQQLSSSPSAGVWVPVEQFEPKEKTSYCARKKLEPLYNDDTKDNYQYQSAYNYTDVKIFQYQYKGWEILDPTPSMPEVSKGEDQREMWVTAFRFIDISVIMKHFHITRKL